MGWVPTGTDPDAIHDNVAGEIAALTQVSAAAADHILIEDDSDSDNKKRVTASSIAALASGASPTFVGAVLTKSSNQTLTTATAIAITFDGEALDSDAFHSTVSNTSRLTIPSGFDGYYLVGGACTFVGNADDGQRYAHLRLNGGSAPQWPLGRGNAESNSAVSVSFNGSIPFSLSEGDYVELFGRQDSGGNLDVVGSSSEETMFWIVKVGS